MGQYEDPDLGGVYYNRFRYYDSLAGVYMSQDPIGLSGGMALYGYVTDCNFFVDPLGLAGMPKGGWNYGNMPKIDGHQLHHIIPRSKATDPAIKAAGFNVDKPSNLIYLPEETGTHPTRSLHKGWNKGHAEYNTIMTEKLKRINKIGKAEGWSKTEYADELEKLKNNTRKGLREGVIKCR
jgi:RHS repeat-associated protein